MNRRLRIGHVRATRAHRRRTGKHTMPLDCRMLGDGWCARDGAEMRSFLPPFCSGRGVVGLEYRDAFAQLQGIKKNLLRE